MLRACVKKASCGLLAAVLVSLLFTVPVGAKKLYSYQDEQGQWHFSDARPDTDAQVRVRPLKVHEKDQKIYVRQIGKREAPVFQVQNLLAGPIEIEFRLTRAENTVAKPSLPRSFVISGGETAKLFSLFPAKSDKPWRYRYQYEIVLGSPEAKHSAQENYHLPFAHGQQFSVSQGFHGDYSHNSTQSRYAVDFAMPDGTPVHAARHGVVMDVARDFYRGGTDRKKFGSRANYVRILHEDGTIALYAHLRWESVLVVPGDTVRRGDVIAKSGSTGYASGPHLHFAVQKNEGMKLISVPFQFKIANKAAPITPQMGDMLTAQ